MKRKELLLCAGVAMALTSLMTVLPVYAEEHDLDAKFCYKNNCVAGVEVDGYYNQGENYHRTEHIAVTWTSNEDRYEPWLFGGKYHLIMVYEAWLGSSKIDWGIRATADWTVDHTEYYTEPKPDMARTGAQAYWYDKIADEHFGIYCYWAEIST